jgi:hypothetical protein
VALWLGEDDLVIEYGGDTLSRYDVSFSTGAPKLEAVTNASGYRIQCRAYLSRTARCCGRPLGRRSAKCPLARKY